MCRFPQEQSSKLRAGIQFQTLLPATIPVSGTSVNVAVAAVVPGSAGNVQAGLINTIVTGLVYPLTVTNALATTSGANAQTPAQALAVFTATVASIGLSSPVAIANAAIGVVASGTSEVVKYSTVFEPWAAAGSGAGSGTAGWTLYIDNGTGTASSGLIAAVTAKLNGATTASGASNPSTGSGIGYRDAGVPFAVSAVVPTVAVVTVSGTVLNTAQAAVSGAIVTAIGNYFTLPFGAPAEQGQIAAAALNSANGQLTSLVVSLYASGSASGVATLTPSISGKVILGSLSIYLSGGT